MRDWREPLSCDMGQIGVGPKCCHLLPQLQLLMTSHITSCIEYLIPTYNTSELLYTRMWFNNVDSLTRCKYSFW